jgi:hypothetical protein
MTEHTPTTDEVRRGYAETIDALGGMHLGHLMFDRWLARHDAEVAAKALGFVQAYRGGDIEHEYIDAAIGRIEREAGR